MKSGNRFLCFFTLIILFSFNLFSQQSRTITLNGFVYDKKNGETLIGANVFIKKYNIGASTNLNGYFAITNVPVGECELSISFIGYSSQVIKIKAEDNLKALHIYLEPEAIILNQVVIKGDSIRTIDKLYEKPISKIELTGKQINSIPKFVEADLLRSLQTLPGIQPLSDFSSALYVRGGTPDQNLYLLDGTDVYNPEHAFGLFSTFNTNAIKQVELSKGGFGAEYGGRLSSILNVTNLDGNRNNFQADVTISLISASTTIQTPLGSIGSLSGSFRRTYIDQTYAKFLKEVPDYYFYDGNVKALFDIDDKNKVVVSFYGGRDKLNFLFDKEASNSLGFKYEWGNTTGSINWRKILNKELFANFWITASQFSSEFTFDEVKMTQRNIARDIAIKGNLEYYISKHFNLRFGFEEKNLYGQLYEKFSGGEVDANKYRNHYTAYILSIWKPTERWNIESGLRYDYFNSEVDYQNLDPRISIKYKLNETTNLKLASGIYHQYLNRVNTFFFASLWTSADEYTKGSSAYHLIGGVQKELFQVYELEIEAYYKKYNDVYSYNPTFLTEIEPSRFNEKNEPVFDNTKGLFNRGDGHSIGLEIMLRKDYGAITGWLGYSLARTIGKVDGLNNYKNFIPRQDRTHTVNWVMNVNINELLSELKDEVYVQSSSKWLLSTNFVYSSGQPITLPVSVYAIYRLPDWQNNSNNIALYPAELNSVRLPAYIRMDLSVTWEKDFGGWLFAPYLQIYNIGYRKNVWFINYENEIKDGKIEQKPKSIYMLPILPSLGINVKF